MFEKLKNLHNSLWTTWWSKYWLLKWEHDKLIRKYKQLEELVDVEFYDFKEELNV